MRKIIFKSAISGILAVAIVTNLVSAGNYGTKADASISKVSISKYYKSMASSLGIKAEDIADKSGIPIDKDRYVTNEKAAVIAQAADVIKNKDIYSREKYKNIKSKKRISDIGAVSNLYRDDVIKCFTKGIMIGKGNGKCSQDRKFSPGAYVSGSEYKKIINRVKNKSSRFKLSPDGQVIRTTNLPKNYKRYKYILASFPNGFYDMPMTYETNKYYYKIKRGRDYEWPCRLKTIKVLSTEAKSGEMRADKYLEKYQDKMVKLLEDNLKLRFSFDYRKSGNKWFNKVRKTYYISGDAEYDKPRTKWIKLYMKNAKKNKVVLQYKNVVVEPSAVYFEGAYRFRCYLKFKCTAKTWKTFSSGNQNEMILGDIVNIKRLKNGKWYEGYFDFEVGSTAFCQPDGTYTVTDDDLIKLK